MSLFLTQKISFSIHQLERWIIRFFQSNTPKSIHDPFFSIENSAQKLNFLSQIRKRRMRTESVRTLKTLTFGAISVSFYVRKIPRIFSIFHFLKYCDDKCLCGVNFNKTFYSQIEWISFSSWVHENEDVCCGQKPK